MVEVKVERRSSGRLVSKRIILSEDEEKFNGTDDENAVDSGNSNRHCRKAPANLDEEEFVPRTSSRLKGGVASDSEGEMSSSSVDYKRSRRERVEELRERRSNRTRRLRESEKLMSEFIEMQDSDSKRRKDSKSRMEEEDAALAAAISAGYFSDEERDLEHVRLRTGTRFKSTLNNPTSTNTTPTYNPYARNGLGSFSGPMRRSGRSAAVVSAARVAMYSTMLNPDSSLHEEESSAPVGANKYNLRPNRPAQAEDPAAAALSAYYEFNPQSRGDGVEDSSMNNLSRLFEEDDVDGHHSSSTAHDGDVSLAALDKIAGMDGYVRKLKEMIVFPLIYPHLFEKLNISLPRGVLFHGPPGTGKTLMARLLASACSTSTRKVSFFMRNGSDCLSKWIGEAERNMRLLFKKAKECQPSIIFFDEIDGLAPERTGRQDQSHISLVSTMLALMDGLDDRGQVVVIGATNRIHSIDAALRRPGRFDREFFFGLPDEAARAQILKIHTKTWVPPIEDCLASDLASRTSGYSGADMKALCVEAALRAVQRTFPEVYNSATKMDLTECEGNAVKIEACDFEFALAHLTPSNRRHVSQYDLVSLQKPQSLLYDVQAQDLKCKIINPMLKRSIANEASGKVSWQLLEPLIIKVLHDPAVHPDSFVWRFLCGIADVMDGFTVHPVDLITLAEDSSGLEAALWRGLNDARLKGGAFFVLFKSFNVLGREERKVFTKALRRFVASLVPGDPVILMYSSSNKGSNDGDADNRLDGPIKRFRLNQPSSHQVKDYLDSILRSIFRLLSSEKKLCVSEEEFVNNFRRRESMEMNVTELERMRMNLCDMIRGDVDAFVSQYFDGLNIIDPVETIVKEEKADDVVPETEDDNGTEAPEDVLFK